MGRKFSWLLSVECSIRLIIPWQFLFSFSWLVPAVPLLSVSPLLFSSSISSWGHKMNLINDYHVMLFKEVDGWALIPQQKCNLAFSWVAGLVNKLWVMETKPGSTSPGIARWKLSQRILSWFHRAHLSLDLRDDWHGCEMQIFPWGLGDLHCLVQCWSSRLRRSRLMMQVLISLGVICLSSAWTAGTGVGAELSHSSGVQLQTRKWGLFFHGG